jgi:steroid 5-alpha reductase family enzyme
MTSPVTLSRPALAPRGIVARTATSKSRACAFGSLPRSLERRRAALCVTTSTPLRRRFSVAASASASPQVFAELAAKATKAAITTTSVVSTMPASLGAALASSFAFPALWAFAAVPCLLAFVNPVYVFSVGYGLSVAAQSIGIAAMLHLSGVWVPTVLSLHLAGAVVYGIRLGAFLYHRSVTWTEWNKRAKNAPEAKARSFSQKLFVVALCSLLYAMMCSPMLWHAQVANVVPGSLMPVTYAGLALQWAGALLEAVADHQKSAHKKKAMPGDGASSDDTHHPWCDAGLYETCRHPNYLGELVFWFGTFLAGVPAMATRGWWSFAPAFIGLAFIAKLMTSQCKKQDEKQKARYVNDQAYDAWVNKSGSLFPKF